MILGSRFSVRQLAVRCSGAQGEFSVAGTAVRFVLFVRFVLESVIVVTDTLC